MAISDTQKIDDLYKKLIYGVTKTDTSTNKSPSNEAVASPLLIRGDQVWNESGLIPTTAPAVTGGVVSVRKNGQAGAVAAIADPTVVPSTRTWHTNVLNWVPPQFGSTYSIKIYADTLGAANPEATGTLLAPDGINNDGYFFDYQAGVLNFGDANVPAALTGKYIYVVGYQYTGSLGVGNSGSLGGTLTVTGATISTSTANGNVSLTANGTGSVVLGSSTAILGNETVTGSITAGGNITAANFSGNISSTNFSAATATITGGSINNTVIGNVTPAAATFTSVTGTGPATFSSINNTPIGNATPSTAAFTTLAASGVTDITNTTQSTSTANGALIVAGGVGIAKNLNVGGDTIITGNLTVNGVSTTVNSTTVSTADVNITLANGAVTSSQANGAGIHVAGANVDITYLAAPNTWNMNVGLSVPTVDSTSTTNSVSPATGAVITAGGAGVAQDLWVGGTIHGNIVTGSLTATGGNITGLTSLTSGTVSTVNAQITGGAITGTPVSGSTVSATTLTTTNAQITGGAISGASVNTPLLTTSNAQVTGGSITGVTTLSATNGTVTNLTSGNVAITGGTISNTAITNSAISGAAGSFTSLTTGAATITGGTLTGVDVTATKLTTANAQVTGGSITGTPVSGSTVDATVLTTANAQVTGGAISGVTVTNSPVSGSTVDATVLTTANAQVTGGAITGTPISGSTGSFTTLSATSFAASSINNTPIGNATPSTAAFTTLTASGVTDITNTTQSTLTTNGALIVAGGVGIAKNLNVGGDTIITGNLTVNGQTTTVNSSTVSTVDANITLASGALNSAQANGAGIHVAGALADITYTSATDTWDLNKGLVAPTIDATGALNSTSSTTGAIVTAGGVGVAQDVFVGGTIHGSVTSANAQITGGAITGTPVSGATVGATTLTTSNAQITGGAVSGVTLSGATITSSPISGSTGAFTTVTADSITATSINNTVIGNVTPASGAFTTLSATSGITGSLVTPTQSNITAVGTLSSLTVSGNVTAGNVISTLYGNVVGNADTASNLFAPALLPAGTTAATAAALDSTANIASTAFVTGAVSAQATITTNTFQTLANISNDGTLATNSTIAYPTVQATKTYADTKVPSNTLITAGTALKITYDAKGLVTAGTTASITDLNDVLLTAPAVDNVLKYNGTKWVNGSSVSTSAGSGVNYYYTVTASDIATYEALGQSPDSAVEVIESRVVNANTVPVDSYVSSVNGIGGTQIDAGIWRFETYAYANVTTGTNTINYDVYKSSSSLATLGTIVAGTGYTNGLYIDVPLTGGRGINATANITVSGNAVTAAVLTNNGTGYLVGDVLSAAGSTIGAVAGKATVAYTAGTAVTPSTSVGILAGTYNVKVNVDGQGDILYAISATGTDTMTSIASLLSIALAGKASVAAVGTALVVTSLTTGPSSSIVVTTPAGGAHLPLFESIAQSLTATISNVSLAGVGSGFQAPVATVTNTETLLFSAATQSINVTSVALFSTSVAHQSFAIYPTDRLVTKVSATTTNASDTLISFVHSGTNNYSHIVTPLVVRHNDLAGAQGGQAGEEYHLTLAEYTGTGSGSFVRKTSPVLTTPTINTPYVTSAVLDGITTFNGKQISTFEGEKRVLSEDASPFREYSWSVTPSGDIYTLFGQPTMGGWMHNTSIDAFGNFTPRDDFGAAEIAAFTEDGSLQFASAVLGNAGITPTFTVGSKINAAGFTGFFTGNTVTQTAGDNSTKLASTAFVASAVSTLASGAVLSFNTRTGAITLSTLDVTTALGYTPVSPTGTGATGTWGINVTGSAATVTANAQPAITSVGTLSSLTVSGAVATGALTANSVTTASATITGGVINGTVIGNVTPAAGTFTTLIGTTGTITNLVTGNAQVTGGSITGTPISGASGAFTTLTAGSLSVPSINNTPIGNATPSTGAFTTLTASSGFTGVLLTNAQPNINSVGTLSDVTVTNAATVGSLVTGNAQVTGGAIDNTVIGGVTPAAGTFTTMNATTVGGTLSTAAQPNVTSVGTLSSLTVSGAVATGALTANSLSTASATITGGAITGTPVSGSTVGATVLTATTGTVTNLSSSNVAITGGALSGVSVAATVLTTANAQITGGAITGTPISGSTVGATVLTATTGTVTNLSTGNAQITGGAISGATITNSPISGSSGSFTSLNAYGTSTASGQFIANSDIASTSITTGAIVVVGPLGGVGVAGNVNIGQGSTINSTKSTVDTIVMGTVDSSLIYASAATNQVMIGNSVTSSAGFTAGAKLIVNSKDSMMVPVGTSGDRPVSPVIGMIRYNSTFNYFEFWNGTSWENTQAAFTVITDQQFTGDNATTVFTLTAASTTNGTIVSINGVVQIPGLAYSVTGTALSFSEAPLTTDVIDVRVLTTTKTITGVSSSNGFVQVIADNAGLNFYTGTGSSVVTWNIDAATGAFGTTAGKAITYDEAGTSFGNVAVAVDSFSATAFRTAKYVVSVTNGSTFQAAEVLVMHDGVNTYATTYGMVSSTGTPFVTFAATLVGGVVSLTATGSAAGNVAKVQKIYVAV